MRCAALVLLLLAAPAAAQPVPLFTDPLGDVQPAGEGTGSDPPTYPPSDGLDIVAIGVGPDTPHYLPLWTQVANLQALEAWTPAGNSPFTGGDARFEWDFTPAWSDATISARAIWDGQWFYSASANGPGYSYGVRVNGTADAETGWIRIDVPRHLFDDPGQGDRLYELDIWAYGTSGYPVWSCGASASCDQATSDASFRFANDTSGGLTFSPGNATETDAWAAMRLGLRNEGISWRFTFDETTRTYDVVVDAPPGWVVDAPKSVTVAQGESTAVNLTATWPATAPAGSYNVTLRFQDEARQDRFVWQVAVPREEGLAPSNATAHAPAQPEGKSSPVGAPVAAVLLALAGQRRFKKPSQTFVSSNAWA